MHSRFIRVAYTYTSERKEEKFQEAGQNSATVKSKIDLIYMRKEIKENYEKKRDKSDFLCYSETQ